MQPTEVVLLVTDAIESLDISYCIGGSFASSAYGEPRATRDVDILVALPANKAALFVARMEPEFFVHLPDIHDAADSAYPRGRHKARVFAAALGLSADDATVLRDALLEAVKTTAAIATEHDTFGQRYVRDFRIQETQGEALVRSTWIVRTGEQYPRLNRLRPIHRIRNERCSPINLRRATGAGHMHNRCAPAPDAGFARIRG